MSEAVPLCGACGAAAFRTSGTCTVCHTHLPSAVVLAPALAGDARVVCVILTQACAHCGTSFAVSALGDNASTACSACGQEQTVAFAELRQILAAAAQAAHATPDRKQRGQGVAYEAAAGRLRATIYRGHPLCDACRRPFAIAIEAGVTTTACGPCAITTTYRAHKIVARAGAPSVVAVVAPFAAIGRRDLAIAEGEGAIALRCPGCAAAVEVGDRRVVTCGYCGAVAWVPDRAWSAKVAKPPAWLVVRAP